MPVMYSGFGVAAASLSEERQPSLINRGAGCNRKRAGGTERARHEPPLHPPLLAAAAAAVQPLCSWPVLNQKVEHSRWRYRRLVSRLIRGPSEAPVMLGGEGEGGGLSNCFRHWSRAAATTSLRRGIRAASPAILSHFSAEPKYF